MLQAAGAARPPVSSYSFQHRQDSFRIVSLNFHTTWSSAMTVPTETALTLVVVKSFAIVGSAFATVLFFAFVGTKRR
jgi:hypothetical protein